MEGHFYSQLFSFPKQVLASSREALYRMESYFFVYYIDHFSDIPAGDTWQSAYGYAQEVAKILFALARRAQSNVVLVGQEGVGSLGIAREVARQIKRHPELKGHKIVFVNMEELLGSVSSGIEQLHIIAKIVSQAERLKNVVIVVSGMQGVFAGKYSLSSEDVLHPFLASSVRTLTILSDEEYHAHIASHKGLSHLVEPVHIVGLGVERTRGFLRKMFGSKVPHGVLEEVLQRTEGVLSHIPYPKRAVDIIEELIANNTVSKEHVAHTISRKVGFDIRRLQDAHTVNLEEVIGRHIVNQEQAIREIVHAMTRARIRSKDIKRPLASMVFTGPKGVGKRETAKAIAQAYFGSSERLVLLDVEHIDEGLPRVITDHSFCVLLLEGVETASKDAQESLRAVLRDGYIADRFGRKYFTTHTIIIVTTKNHIVSEDLVHSFDGVATFVQLNPEHVKEVARRMLARFNGRLQMEHNVSLDVTPELIEYVVQKGFSEESGVHSMAEVVRSTVEETMTQLMRKGSIVPGKRITIDPGQLK